MCCQWVPLALGEPSAPSALTGQLRFIEVKGRVKGAETVTITKNEILTALNKPDEFILAVMTADGELAHRACLRLETFS